MIFFYMHKMKMAVIADRIQFHWSPLKCAHASSKLPLKFKIVLRSD